MKVVSPLSSLGCVGGGGRGFAWDASWFGDSEDDDDMDGDDALLVGRPLSGDKSFMSSSGIGRSIPSNWCLIMLFNVDLDADDTVEEEDPADEAAATA